MPVAIAIVAVNIALDVGASAGVAAVIGNAVLAVSSAVIAAAPALGLSIISNLLFRPSVPKAEDGNFPIHQTIPPRQAGYGKARIAGFYMLYEVTSGNHSRDVLALHDGRIDGFERFYLSQDQVTFESDGRTVSALPDGRYSTGHVLIDSRLGLATETAYAPIISDLPGVWTEQHRGDGIASLALYCNSTSQTNYSKYYPNGLPLPSVLARLRQVYDYRVAAQSPTDPNTWTWSANPFLCLCHYLCFAGDGPGFDYTQRILPQLASWIEAANVCGEIVALKAGGNEPRYQLGGIYRFDNDPADVIKNLLDSCDGWIGEDGAGGLVAYAGKFYAPTLTIPADHIIGYQLPRFVADEQAVNQMGFSYTEPQNDYASVDGDPWIDQVDLTARGKIRAQNSSLPWVQSHSQGRRLVKRAVMRANAERSGTITTNLFGLQALGQRYLNFVIPELPSLAAGFIVEVRKVQLDLQNLQVVFTVTGTSAAIDEWDPATEEGNAPVIPQTVEAGLPPTPVNVTVSIDPASVTSVDQGVQLDVSFTPPTQTGLSFDVQYQIQGAATWTQQHFDQDYNLADAAVTLRTAFVGLNQTYNVQVRTVASKGTPSDWSATETITTSQAAIPPAQPTMLAASPGAVGSGQATVTWRNPTSSNFDHSPVYRANQGSPFSSAVVVDSPLGGLGASQSFTDNGLTPGSYSYWVAAASSAGATSSPAGPVNVTVS